MMHTSLIKSTNHYIKLTKRKRGRPRLKHGPTNQLSFKKYTNTANNNNNNKDLTTTATAGETTTTPTTTQTTVPTIGWKLQTNDGADESNIRLAKKKKELRKKKWREAHWKRKIDLSYIEATSLAKLSQNIADNLAFCIDGTHEDLRSYARECKDYLSTELGEETHAEMLLKCCLPELYEDLMNESSAHAAHHLHASQLLDANLASMANSYFAGASPLFTDSISSAHTAHGKSTTTVFDCDTCRFRCHKLADLVQHQRHVHKLVIPAVYDLYNKSCRTSNKSRISQVQDVENACLVEQTKLEQQQSVNWRSSNTFATSPVGYLACDPFAFAFSLHWDEHMKTKKCERCGGKVERTLYQQHLQTC